MHIALIAPDKLVPPVRYGGTQRIIAWLAEALNDLGHKTTLVAQKGSNVSGSHMIHLAPGESLDSVLPKNIDILHYWETPRNAPSKWPLMVTIESNGQPGEIFHPNTVFVSKRHAANHQSEHFVYNGINPVEYESSPIRKNYVVFLALAALKRKNLSGTVEVARAAGIKLEVLGSNDRPLHWHRILPRLRGTKYHGMVTNAEKREILPYARALLFPVRFHEPFGIAIIEALLAGCPVFGTPYGSLPEIVTSDVGILSNRTEDLVEGLLQSDQFSPERCRERVLSLSENQF